MAKGFKIFDNDMQTDIGNYPDGQEMPINYATGKIINGKPVWRPAVIGTNPSFDLDIQTRSIARVVGNNDVTINYMVTDKDLATIKALKKKEAKAIGKNLLLAKRNVEDQRNAALGILAAQEITDIKADINTIRNYYKDDFVPSINACTTVQQVKAVAIDFPNIS
jgi:hypothetical protein